VIRNGRLLIDEDVKYGVNSVLGNSTNDLWLCDDQTQSGDLPFLAFEGGGTRSVSRGIQVNPASGAQPTLGAVTDITVNFDKGIVLSNNLWIASVSSDANAIKFNSVISGPGGLVKIGAGISELNAANTYTGVTEVADGTLRFGAAGTVSAESSLKLTGGVLDLNGTDQMLSTLEVDGSAVIDFSNGDSIINFDNSSALAWSGSLLVKGWSGDAAGGGSDQLIIGSSAEGLTPAQLARITTPTGETARQLPSGEVVFIPAGTLMMVR